MYALPHAGGAADVRRITGVFQGDPQVTSLSFQQGSNGYAQAHDTWIESASPANAHDAGTQLVSDGSPQSQGLIRFDGIFGTGPARVPTGAVVLSAKLTFYTGLTTSDASVDRMNVHRLT